MTNQPNRELSGDELTHLYSELCDVAERIYHHWPLDDPDYGAARPTMPERPRTGSWRSSTTTSART